MKTNRVEFANTLRGLAAIFVLLEHYHSFFAGDRTVIAAMINAPVMPNKIFLEPDYLAWLYSVPHLIWSSLGVALFFVISGFVIPFSIKSGSRGAFLFGRFFRIYPLYAVGFGITLFSIYVTGKYFGNEWPLSIDQVLPHFLPGLRELTGSRVSIDGIIWTLEIEIKFYIVCALIAPWIRRSSAKVFFVPIGIVAIDHILNIVVAGYAGSLTSIGSPFLAFMFVGVAFHYLYNGSFRPSLAALIIATIYLAFCLSITYGPNVGFQPILWSYGAAILLFGFAFRFQWVFGRTTIGSFFADISYPLYVIHGVAGYAMLRILVENGLPGAIAIPIVAMVVFAIAKLLNITVEEWGRREGKRLYTILTRQNKVA